MTFCIGIKVRDGLVGLADTRIVRGSEQTSKSKVSQLRLRSGNLFLMTSGLRSVRDKAFVYFEEQLTASDATGPTKMFEAANMFGRELRRVRSEDGASLADAGMNFNLHAIMGGKLAADSEPKLFYIYPEGNWVEATDDSPYHVIGRTSYGKPILDRLLDARMSLGEAVALAFLAFDATRASVTDVDFPLDIVVIDSAAGGGLREHRFDTGSLEYASDWWEARLRAALADFPLEWAQPLRLIDRR